jgi:hypothetical protein
LVLACQTLRLHYQGISYQGFCFNFLPGFSVKS